MKPIPSCLCRKEVIKAVFRGEACPSPSELTCTEHLLGTVIGSGDPGKNKIRSSPVSEPLLK